MAQLPDSMKRSRAGSPHPNTVHRSALPPPLPPKLPRASVAAMAPRQPYVDDEPTRPGGPAYQDLVEGSAPRALTRDDGAASPSAVNGQSDVSGAIDVNVSSEGDEDLDEVTQVAIGHAVLLSGARALHDGAGSPPAAPADAAVALAPAAADTDGQRQPPIGSTARRPRRSVAAVGAAMMLLGLGGGFALRGVVDELAPGLPVRGQSTHIFSSAIARATAVPQPGDAAAGEAANQGATAAGGGCLARVITEPDGIEVRWGTLDLGVTPLNDVPVPCGEALVALAHPRYERVERSVVAEPGAPALVETEMKRPVGRLELRSIPPGARFTVEGTAAGAAPTSAEVRAFSSVEVTAELPGYQPWTRRVYLRSREESVVAPLERSSARTAAPVGARR